MGLTVEYLEKELETNNIVTGSGNSDALASESNKHCFRPQGLGCPNGFPGWALDLEIRVSIPL
jgi:hypothetical protein